MLRVGTLLFALLIGATGVAPDPVSAESRADVPVPGSGAPRPRLLYDPGTESALRTRLDREPYRTLFVTMAARADRYDDQTLGDHSITAQRDLLRAAKARAFEYALDRTVVGGDVVPFPSDSDRAAAGDYARDVLLQMFDRSRLAVPPPLGGWDRDISTSEEIILAATVYDTLLGAGYDLGSDEAEIVRRLRSVTDELWRNFVDPASAGGYSDLHQNNHRTKSGAAMALAAVTLADQVPEARQWFDTGVDYVDDTLRHVLLTGDGAYAEGAFYYRYTTQNLVPLLAAWERLLGGRSWTTDAGLTVPALARHPLFARSQRWMIDVSVPDGSLAPIDDGNPGRSHFGGALPAALPTTSAAYWRWTHTPEHLSTDASIDLSADAIVAYDDTIAPAPPSWEPTQVYEEGGTATLRSDWSEDATMALVLGEHDTASEFGRDRTGQGRYPQSHEHADPAAYLLYAFGERLALDPGYLSFSDHGLVNQPEDHNIVLIDGEGPPDYLAASFAWAADPAGRPPAEGQSTLADAVVSDAGDAVSVATAYRGAQIDRRVIFGADRYLVVADEVDAPAGAAVTWMLHGNGGGSSGGDFAPSPVGGRWTIGGARLDSGIATTAGEPALAVSTEVHEGTGAARLTHSALAASTTAPGSPLGAIQLLYPTRSGAAPPAITRTRDGGSVTLVATDPVEDRQVTVVQRGSTASDLEGAGIATDGDLLVVERTIGGDLLAVWAEGATRVRDATRSLIASATPGTLAQRWDDGDVEVVADTDSPTVEVAVATPPASLDGACGSTLVDATATVALGHDRRATLLGAAGGGRPAADAGADRRVTARGVVALDGAASCDSDGSPSSLRPHWELVSAPAGSAWRVDGADTWEPRLTTDRVGPYRVRLVVTDADGSTSLEDEVRIIAGDQCADGVDDDLDGLIDTDDADCDGAAAPPVPPGPPRPPDPGVPSDPSPTAPPTPSAPPAVPLRTRARFTG